MRPTAGCICWQRTASGTATEREPRQGGSSHLRSGGVGGHRHRRRSPQIEGASSDRASGGAIDGLCRPSAFDNREKWVWATAALAVSRAFLYRIRSRASEFEVFVPAVSANPP